MRPAPGSADPRGARERDAGQFLRHALEYAWVRRARCEAKSGTVHEDKKPQKQIAPQLYDLTTLQREAPFTATRPPAGATRSVAAEGLPDNGRSQGTATLTPDAIAGPTPRVSGRN